MSTPSELSSLSLKDSFNLEQAFKQFSLETERLEMTYRSLQDSFKTVQQTLQESQTRISGKLTELDFVSRYLEAILNHISQGIIFIDLNGIVTTYNVAACELLHIPEKELLFHPYQDFFEDQFFGFSLEEVFKIKQCPPTTLITLNQNQQILELEIEATFVSMSQQTYPLAHRHSSAPPVPIQGLLLLLRDMTKMRRLQQIADRNDRLKELGELAAHLAHEIRNPLGGIKGFATLLQQELSERSDLQQMASYIVEGTDDLNHFVSNVLTYARPFQLHLESIDIVHFIEDLRLFMQADPSWNSNLTFNVESSVTTLTMQIDTLLFKSALLNLFVNAIQAMPHGGILTVKIELNSSWVTLQVKDTGSGILPEHLPKIFSPFFTTKEAGNGLGLAEVHKVIQAHHGWIDVHSEAGKGTTFTIKIPLKSGD